MMAAFPDGSLLAFIKRDEIPGREPVDAMGIRFQVIDEPYVLQPERFFDVLIGDDPREDSSLPRAPASGGAGDAGSRRKPAFNLRSVKNFCAIS